MTSTLRAEALEKLARAAAIRGDFTTVRRLIAQAVKLPTLFVGEPLMPTRVTKILFSDRGGVSEAGTHERHRG